ncbi:hypothetical protein BpHYR1_012476 [Brachionus plicatilis]|uniref:Transmembrane protein n=1 Tax=Brachionus plicatilis TaxID=10195 RepID=A0A3M7T4N0_BRAPC|nr:hypothetical protein BpHYR1_012476 [Brachionus plicatilis]
MKQQSKLLCLNDKSNKQNYYHHKSMIVFSFYLLDFFDVFIWFVHKSSNKRIVVETNIHNDLKFLYYVNQQAHASVIALKIIEIFYLYHKINTFELNKLIINKTEFKKRKK